MDYEFVPGRDDFPPDEIAMLRQQLADVEESNKAVEKPLNDVDYRGTYADGVLYLKQQLAAAYRLQAEANELLIDQARQLAAAEKERNSFQDQCIRLKHERVLEKEQLAAALAACESIKGDVNRCYKMLLSDPDTVGALFKAENILREALLTNTDASALKAHDEALIERCAAVCDELEYPECWAAKECAEGIRALKEWL